MICRDIVCSHMLGNYSNTKIGGPGKIVEIAHLCFINLLGGGLLSTTISSLFFYYFCRHLFSRAELHTRADCMWAGVQSRPVGCPSPASD
jgi:hypothetical protein